MILVHMGIEILLLSIFIYNIISYQLQILFIDLIFLHPYQ